MQPVEGRSRWATDPERIDPDDYPERQPYVKLLTWALCPACDLQVHTPLTRYLLQGLACPLCGDRLLDAPSEPSERLSEILRREDLFAAELDA